MRAEGDLIVDKVHLVDHILANEGGAHVIVGVGVGRRTSLLKPEESVLNAVNPGGVLSDTFVCIGRRRNLETKFIPVGTATASLVGALGVARAHTDTSIKIPVGQTILRGWETLLAIEGFPITGNNTAYLISRPVAQKFTASYLKKICEAWVETYAAFISICAL